VLSGNLTLGQLVAAQIIVSTTLVSLEKLIRQSEKYFDLLAGLDKIAVLTELPLERTDGCDVPSGDLRGMSVEIRNLHFAYPSGQKVLKGLNLNIAPGARISLVGASGAGKSTLAAILCGMYEPETGEVLLNDVDIREIELGKLREQVVTVGYEPEIFHGTIEDNIRVGRDHISSATLRWAIETAGMTGDLAQISGGLQAELISGGGNISRGQLQRILLARAILGRPKLLILDESSTGIDEKVAREILDRIFSEENSWTIIDISHQPDVIVRTREIVVMKEGQKCQAGAVEELANDLGGEFAEIFPFLSDSVRTGNSRLVGGGR
jgi:ATP-binding cassette subfamily B protein